MEIYQFLFFITFVTCILYLCIDLHSYVNKILSSEFSLINKSATLLDNIYSNYCLDNCNCGILCTDFSDHFPVFCIIDNITLACKQKTVVKRIFNNKNINKFSHLMDHNWNHIFNISDVSTMIYLVIDHLIENCFQEQTVTMNYNNRHPWLTPKLKASIKKRNSMSNVCKQNPDNMDLHDEYKSYRI